MKISFTATVNGDDILEEFEDDDLIDELAERGYIVKEKVIVEIDKTNDRIWSLHRAFVSSTPEQFREELRAFFLKELGEYVR
jgi:hypothetical protein